MNNFPSQPRFSSFERGGHEAGSCHDDSCPAGRATGPREDHPCTAHLCEPVQSLSVELAHHLTDICAAILLSAGLTLAEGASDTASRHLHTIREAADRGAEIALKLRAVARLGSSRWEVVDLGRSAVDALERIDRAHRVHVTVDAAPTPVPVRLPAGAVDEIIAQLIANAVQASRGGGTVHVSVGLEQTGQRFATLQVMDWGVGMNPTTLVLARQPFFTTRWTPTALGLGIPLVEALVARAGGALDLHSTVGAGTVATIRLPLVER